MSQKCNIGRIEKLGTYKFLEPFNTITENIKLTKVSSRSIREILDAGIDVYKLVYEKVNLDRKVFEDDIIKNISIYVFMDASGRYIYIPEQYVKDNSNVDSVKYSNYILGINLGPLPENYDLSIITSQIDELVIKSFGIKPNIKIAKTSNTTYVDKETHNELETKRNILKNEQISPWLERLQLEALVRKQNDQINKLKCAIKYLVNNCTGGNGDDFLENIDLTILEL